LARLFTEAARWDKWRSQIKNVNDRQPAIQPGYSPAATVTFVRGTLTNHFPVENNQSSLHDRHDRHDRRRSVICREEAYRGSYRTYQADMCTRLRIAMQMCRQTKSISVHVHVHTYTKRICR
jgi:hypothetical protein